MLKRLNTAKGNKSCKSIQKEFYRAVAKYHFDKMPDHFSLGRYLVFREIHYCYFILR